jgi:hypothetical protein
MLPQPSPWLAGRGVGLAGPGCAPVSQGPTAQRPGSHARPECLPARLAACKIPNQNFELYNVHPHITVPHYLFLYVNLSAKVTTERPEKGGC